MAKRTRLPANSLAQPQTDDAVSNVNGQIQGSKRRKLTGSVRTTNQSPMERERTRIEREQIQKNALLRELQEQLIQSNRNNANDERNERHERRSLEQDLRHQARRERNNLQTLATKQDELDAALIEAAKWKSEAATISARCVQIEVEAKKGVDAEIVRGQNELKQAVLNGNFAIRRESEERMKEAEARFLGEKQTLEKRAADREDGLIADAYKAKTGHEQKVCEFNDKIEQQEQEHQEFRSKCRTLEERILAQQNQESGAETSTAALASHTVGTASQVARMEETLLPQVAKHVERFQEELRKLEKIDQNIGMWAMNHAVDSLAHIPHEQIKNLEADLHGMLSSPASTPLGGLNTQVRTQYTPSMLLTAGVTKSLYEQLLGNPFWFMDDFIRRKTSVQPTTISRDLKIVWEELLRSNEESPEKVHTWRSMFLRMLNPSDFAGKFATTGVISGWMKAAIMDTQKAVIEDTLKKYTVLLKNPTSPTLATKLEQDLLGVGGNKLSLGDISLMCWTKRCHFTLRYIPDFSKGYDRSTMVYHGRNKRSVAAMRRDLTDDQCG
ncbi:hypothetical protein EJ08DRAFT_659565 [Tothia fuscella]|uniref:Uncharacterized protein n=1 Tax=Tothia fuscella TaxID=1048955 RepID=A0A9P4NUK1_9PEZI|nr:hypothetical protein EJ08DRAFT_659565 [Tothia fuscella]